MKARRILERSGDWLRCNFARYAGAARWAKVLNSLDVRRTSHSGVADKSDRIFIDAKLAISSPVTIPELCISLGDSRFQVYPSRSFPSADSTRSTLFPTTRMGGGRVFCPLAASTPDPKPPSAAFSAASTTFHRLLQPLFSLSLSLARCISRARERARSLPSFGALSPMETSLIGRTKGRKKRGHHPRIRPITVNVRDNARDICWWYRHRQKRRRSRRSAARLCTLRGGLYDFSPIGSILSKGQM